MTGIKQAQMNRRDHQVDASAGSRQAFDAACFAEADVKAAPEADVPAACGAAGYTNG